jgi:acyl-CoA synthetase (AMP-forming)/AMP-acid ligase II
VAYDAPVLRRSRRCGGRALLTRGGSAGESATATPREVILVDELPRTRAGKLLPREPRGSARMARP